MARIELSDACELAGDTALRAQRAHRALLWVQLAIAVLVTLLPVGVWATAQFLPESLHLPLVWVAPATLVLFSVALLVRVGAWFGGFEDRWYDTRGIAERLKTMAWSYAMRARRYGDEEGAADYLRDAKFLVSKDRGGFGPKAGLDQDTAHVSPDMEQTRARDVGARRDLYLSYRVEEQLQWFLRKSASAKRWQLLLTIAFVLAQMGGWAVALAQTLKLGIPSDWYAVASVAGAATLAWAAARKDTELAATYRNVALDLRHAVNRAPAVDTEESLRSWVDYVEEILEAESHGWVTRRRAPDERAVR